MYMKKEDIYDFLLRAAIPCIDEAKRLPEDLQWKRGKKEEKQSEDGYLSKKLVWECIARAHRDVLTGRKNVEEKYSSKKNEDGINVIALFLYNVIIKNPDKLSSKYLIDRLMNECEDCGIGVIQKLVNMTLKYMFILQLFDKLDGYIIAESSCDCPLDSRILDSLGMSDLKWTKDFNASNRKESKKNYDIIQGEIAKRQKGQSKLAYDFANWQSF